MRKDDDENALETADYRLVGWLGVVIPLHYYNYSNQLTQTVMKLVVNLKSYKCKLIQ